MKKLGSSPLRGTLGRTRPRQSPTCGGGWGSSSARERGNTGKTGTSSAGLPDRWNHVNYTLFFPLSLTDDQCVMNLKYTSHISTCKLSQVIHSQVRQASQSYFDQLFFFHVSGNVICVNSIFPPCSEYSKKSLRIMKHDT